MSKETERLFKPGECYIILPDQTIYIFKNPNREGQEEAARLRIDPIQTEPDVLYGRDNPFRPVPVHVGFGFYQYSAVPVAYVQCKSVDIFSKHRQKIDAMIKSHEMKYGGSANGE